MTPQPFNLDVLATYKCFYLLNHIPAGTRDIDIVITVPDGEDLVDFVDLFTMNDGRILAAWQHPMQKLPLHNLIALAGDRSEIINLNNVERVLPHFDRPVTATNGAFLFTDSAPVPNGDWRCDRGMYGPVPFVIEQLPRVFNEVSELIVFEHLLTVNGVGSMIYIESRDETPRGTYLIGNSVAPATTRTFQELVRLTWEWAQLADAPFYASDRTAVQAKAFLSAMKLTGFETTHIRDTLTPMQISRFLSGDTDARKRPDSITSMDSTIEKFLFDRMAASTLSFIVQHNPTLWDVRAVWEREVEELHAGYARFHAYYELSSTTTINDTEVVVTEGSASKPTEVPYVQSQIKQFQIKNDLLTAIADAL